MAAIDNPSYRVFAREQLRPLAEDMRALKARYLAMKTKYNSQINNVGGEFANAQNTDTIVENRAAEGVNDLTKLQITQLVGQLDDLADINDEIVSIPCVRALNAS